MNALERAKKYARLIDDHEKTVSPGTPITEIEVAQIAAMYAAIAQAEVLIRIADVLETPNIVYRERGE